MNDIEYRKLAEVEDRMWYFRALHAHMTRELRRAALPGRPMRILDAGCGTGGLLRRLRECCPDWTCSGLDISPQACLLSRERTGAPVLEATIEDMPYADASFEAIVSADVLCQVEKPELAISEFFRVLRPGGLAVINLPAHKWLWSYHDELCGNRRRFSRAELRALLSSAGFRGIQVRTWNSLLMPALLVRRKLLKQKQSTDVEMPPVPLQVLLSGVMLLERAWLGSGLGLPPGCSWLAIARKPMAGERMG